MDIQKKVLGVAVGDTLTNFPPSFSYDGLSVLLNRSPASLQADRCRKPHSLPPACQPPGCKSPVWLLADVLAWLAQHREAQALVPVSKKRGAPTKAERVALARRERGAQ